MQPSVITVVMFEDYLLLSDLGPVVITIAARVWPQSFGHTDLPWPLPSSALTAAVPLIRPTTPESNGGN